MTTVVVCPRGHSWELLPSQTTVAEMIACPVCGALVNTPQAGTGKAGGDETTPRRQDLTTVADSGRSPPVSPLPPLSQDITDGSNALPPAPPGASAPSPQILTQRAQFTVLHPHAQGGLGTVSIALDQTTGRQVALKQIRPMLADNVASRMRFLSEAEITAQLEHPGIVPIYALGMDAQGRPFYAMKLVRGQTLGEAIEAHHRHPSPLAFADLLRRFVSVCEAIAYAHSRGVIHRDLKPANIMLGQFGETLILDWGLAKRVGADDRDSANPDASPPTYATPPRASWVTHDGAVVGTPAYMPPEQASGKIDSHAPAADIYSLGAVLYQILTGRPPHTGDSAAKVISSALVGRAPAVNDHPHCSPRSRSGLR